MELPQGRWLEARGFVTRREKHALLAGAAVVVLPSPYESLSMAVLEAWTHGRPVLVSARSPVLVGQVRRAGGGLWFDDGAEYAEALWRLVDDRGLGGAARDPGPPLRARPVPPGGGRRDASRGSSTRSRRRAGRAA